MDNTIAKDTTDKPVAKNETKEKLEKTDRKKSSGNGKLKAGMAVFLIGIATLVAGVVLLVINLVAKPAVRDADYLVSVGKWELEDDSNCASENENTEEATANCIDGSGVIWEFTEIGKGKLTTNNHKNDYNFIWSLDKDELKIETAWLYTLENSYTYKLDQDKQILTLTTGEGESLVSIYFHPASSADAEIIQDN